MLQENKLVAEIQKSDIEIIRVSLTQYRNKDYFDIRLYYREDGDWRPTKKGLTLAIGLLPELKKAIQALDKALTQQQKKEL